MNGIVMDIQRFCVQDGPGIRSTVFLKGCNMHCKWCHNPESMKLEPQVLTKKDNRCGGANNLKPQICGKRMTPYEVLAELDKDGIYYKGSGGGITFSGGEPTLQYEFLLELLKLCKQREYHTAIETNGMIIEEHLKNLLEYVDLFLLDYKAEENDLMTLTGGDAKLIAHTMDILNTHQATVYLRCPIIPGINDNPTHFMCIRDLKKKYQMIKKVEIMSYHDVGKSKWEECGMKYELSEIPSATKEQKRMWEMELTKTE